MRSENDDRGEMLSMRVPRELRAALERDAQTLGVSVSDVGRMRLRTGTVPTLERKEQRT